MYRVEFAIAPDSADKLTTYFFGRFELGHSLEAGEAEGAAPLPEGLRVKLRLKRYDMMGERDRGYAAHDEEEEK